MGLGVSDDTEQLRLLAETTESTAGIDLCTVGYDLDQSETAMSVSRLPLSGEAERYVYIPRRALLPITRAEGRPYCCAAAGFDGGDEYDANVYRTSPLLHVIMHYRFDTLIESVRLKDPDFDLPRWYRQMVVHSFAPDHQSCYLSARGERMGHALAIGTQRILEATIPWPDRTMADVMRFSCVQRGAMVRVFDMYQTFTPLTSEDISDRHRSRSMTWAGNWTISFRS
ncbi:hypothetical protein C8Q77DRAFT_1122855 [Trametes polyzona]|nr:hypothetical protein C8Q77DRAFT_1122855 [Trametes polyzona]